MGPTKPDARAQGASGRCKRSFAPLCVAALIAALGLVLMTSLAPAATLCGTVCDAQTLLPVPHAGVFVRTTSGTYTGFYAATDADGWFCITDLPPGIYDLEARVDDYRVAYVKGVVVGGTIDVTIAADLAPVVFALPRPNPAAKATRLRWTLADPAPVRLTIFDSTGRPVRGWRASVQPAGPHSVVWDLRDNEGREIAPGIYWARLFVGRARYTRTLVRIR